MGVEGEDTAPKSAPSHSALRVSTVLSGRATPVCLKVSKPASRSTKLNFRFRLEGRASRRRRPAGMTSRPMPSPGMRPVLVVSLEGLWVDGENGTYSEGSGCHCCCCCRGGIEVDFVGVSGLWSSRLLEFRPMSLVWGIWGRIYKHKHCICFIPEDNSLCCVDTSGTPFNG